MSRADREAPSLALLGRGIRVGMAKRFGKVRQRADTGSWYVDLRPHGRISSLLVEGVGKRPLDKPLAEMVLDWIRAEIAAGKSAQEAVDPYLARPKVTVGARAAAWLEELETRAQAGLRSPEYVRQIRRQASQDGIWGPLWDLSVHQLTRGTIDRWALSLVTKGYAPSTQRTMVAYLRAFMGWLHRNENIPTVPPFPSIEVPDHAARIISASAQDLTLEHIPEDRRGPFITVVELLVRPNEARALDVENYDRQSRVLTIAHAMKGQHVSAERRSTKEGDVRYRDVSDRLHDWIEEHVPRLRIHSGETPLFVNPLTGRRWGHDALARTWRRAAARVGYPEIRFYEGTKHSTATALRSHGVPLDVIQAAAGHKSARSTERDAQVLPPLVREALRKRTG